MKFAFVGELRIGPLVLLGRSSHYYRWNRNFRFPCPVRWFGANAPNVSRLIQSQSNQPILALRAQRNTVGNPRRSTRPAWQFVQLYWDSRLQWRGKPHPTALRIHN